MSLLALAGTNSATGGYEIANSLKFEDDNDEWLYRTNATGTNRRTWTVSWWFKQTELRSVNGAAAEHWQGGGYGEATRAGIFADDRIWIDIGGGDGNTGTLFRSLSTARLRDTAAWYHIVIACDSTQSTEADRLKVWLNGVEVTAWDQRQYPTLNYESALQGTGGVQMKWGSADATYHGYSGYLAECNYVDGVTATQNDFGEFDEDTGIWKPKAYTGSYGTNGSYLDFEIANDLGANAKGNDVNFSLNNITSADQATDTPTNNFCTFNAISVVGTSTYTEGGTVGQANKQNDQGEGTIMFSSGNWYFEMQVPSSSASSDAMFGFAIPNEWGPSNPGDDSGKGFSVHNVGRWYYNNNGSTSTDSSAAFAKGDIVSLAINTSSEKAWVAINGTWATGTNPATGTGGFSYGTLLTSWESGSYLVPAFRTHYVSGSESNANFGGFTVISISTPETAENGYGTFEYAPPSGYYALCTKNLEEYG